MPCKELNRGADGDWGNAVVSDSVFAVGPDCGVAAVEFIEAN